MLTMKNLILRIAILSHCCLSLGIQAAREDWPALVLDERVLRISQIAADLSVLAYDNTTLIDQFIVDVNETTGIATYEHPDYDEIDFFTEEPDQAIVAKKEGRCYLAFRGTTQTIQDWLQNAGLGTAVIYKDNIDTGNPSDSCSVRGGFADFLSSGPLARGREDLQRCVDTCEDPDDCLVLTGHSQGGATASVAAITLFSLKPILVTFGQPPTMDPGCAYIDNTRYYRYVNWLQVEGEDNDIGFDLVVYAPNWISGSEHYGFNILVGEDPANVYYGGYGNDVEFFPDRADDSVSAHTMSGTNYSYQERIYNLYANLPDIGTNGSFTGTICTDDYMELCESKSCVENVCIPIGGVEGTCIKGSCERDADCAGDLVCIWDACAVRDGEVEPGCPCGTSSQCFNKDCITVNALSLDFVCNPDTPNIPKTNETCIENSCELDTDCMDGMVCIYGACATSSGEVEPGCPCATSSQCSNGDCISANSSSVDYVCNPAKDPVSMGSSHHPSLWFCLGLPIMIQMSMFLFR